MMVDEGLTFRDFYPDCDGHGHGDATATASNACTVPPAPPPMPQTKTAPSEVEARLKQISPDQLTPLEALNLIYELRNLTRD